MKGKIIKNIQQKKVKVFSIILLFCTLFLAACGGGRKTTADDPNRVVYVSQSEALAMDAGMSAVAKGEDSIYVFTSAGTGGQQKSSILKAGLLDKTRETITLFDLTPGETVNGLALNSAGNFLLFATAYDETNQSFVLYEAASDGKKVGETELTGLLTENKVMAVNGMTGDGQGNIFLTAVNDSGATLILRLDQTGALLGKMESPEYITNIFCADDGSVYTVGWGSNQPGMALKKIDLPNGSMGTEVALKGIINRGTVALAAGGTTGILVSDGTGIYECDAATGECAKLLDYLDSGIYVQQNTFFGAAGEGAYWMINQSFNSRMEVSGELVLLNPTTAGELPKKEVIVYGTYGNMSGEIAKLVVQFNKENPRYRIEVKDFTPREAVEYEYQEAMDQFNAALIGSEPIDIVDLVTIGDYQTLVNKGILEDLNPYFEKSEAIKKEDYQENILGAYEQEGKLYGVVFNYIIEALVGKEELLRDYDRWNIEEVIAFAEQHPEAELFRTGANGVLISFLSRNFERFVDWNTGECFFDTDDFTGILEFANRFEKTDSVYSWGPDESGKEYLLNVEYIGEASTAQAMEMRYGGPVKYMGYPSDEGNGIVILPYSIGMNERSRIKDGVWEFMSFILSDKAQDPDNLSLYSLPLKKSAIEKLIEKATEKQVTADENGQQAEVPQMVMGMEMGPCTEAQIAQFRDLIGRADSLVSNDTHMFDIIMEEAESYFSGQKTVAEAVEIIQSRCQVYVDENR